MSDNIILAYVRELPDKPFVQFDSGPQLGVSHFLRSEISLIPYSDSMTILSSDMVTYVHSAAFIDISVKIDPIVISDSRPSVRILMEVMDVYYAPRFMSHMMLNDFIYSRLINRGQASSER